MARPTAKALALVSRLAAGQWGLLTTAQAEREGVTRLQLARLAGAAVLDRVDHGVYATTAAGQEHQALYAAWLSLDRARTAEERLADPIVAGVISHSSAAGLHRLGDLLDDVPEITLPGRKQTRRGIRLHRGALTEADVTIVDGLPTTTPERTVADLLRDRNDPEHISQIIGEGVRRGVINLGDLAVRLEPIARRNGQPDGPALVEHLLDLAGLSSTALVRGLADTPAGRELVAMGAAGAISQLVESLGPQLESLPRSAPVRKMLATLDVAPAFDINELVAVRGLAEALEPLQAQLDARSPQIAPAPPQLTSPRTQAAIAPAEAAAARLPHWARR